MRHREKWNIYFWLKMIEEQQKIRSVLKEFISHKPHIWYIYIYLTWFVRIHGSIAEDEVFTQLIGYFVYQIFALDIKTWTKRSFITSYWSGILLLFWRMTPEKYKIQCISDQMLWNVFFEPSHIFQQGMPALNNSAVSWNIVQRGGGEPMFNNCCEFLCVDMSKS